MIGTVIAVGIHQGRWLYVTRLDGEFVYGRVWSSVRARWSQRDVWYSRDAIDKKAPHCAKPLPPPATREEQWENRLASGVTTADSVHEGQE